MPDSQNEKQIRWTRTVVGVLIAAMIAGLSMLVVLGIRQRGHEPRAATAGPTQQVITGLASRASLGGGMAYSLTAEQLVVGKRKFGPLTLNPAREIVLSGVRIELDLPRLSLSPSQRELDLRPVLDDLIEQHDLGIISRIVVRRLTLICRRGEANLSVAANKLVLGADGVPAFEGQVSIESHTGDRLEADAASWNPDQNRIRVRGPFVLHDDRGTHRGHDASFRLGADGRIRQV